MKKGDVAISLVALASSTLVATVSAALTPVTDLTASANGYDERVDGWGCAPSGCLPSNAIDGSLEYPSRWSCVRYLLDGYGSSSDQNEICELTLHLPEPTDIEEVRLALWKGDRRTRSFNIVVDEVVMGEFTSSGATESFETYELTATLASKVVIQAQQTTGDNSWFSLLEVQLMTESEVVTTPTPVQPTDSAVLTPVTDLTASANGYDGRVDGSGCAPSGCLPSNAIDGSLEYPSRWSCVRYLIDGYDSSSDGMCELTLHLLEPTNIEEVRVALWKGDQRTRSFNIVIDEVVMGEFTSSGTTESFETYEVTATLASKVVIQAQQTTFDNSWFSVLEVQLMTESEVAPTPTPVQPTDPVCSTGSIRSSLEVQLSYSGVGTYLNLNAEEPSGALVDQYDKGDVGILVSVGFQSDPGMKYTTYLLMNGLDVAEDPIFGDYTFWVTGGEEGEEYLLTARASGELLWAVEGVIGSDPWNDDQPTYTATIKEYEESDCKSDTYGDCQPDTFSADGTPPCTDCPFGDVTISAGQTECVLGALVHLNLPQSVADAIVEDAVGGFAGPGWAVFDDRSWFRVLLAEDANVLSLTGTFHRWEYVDPTIPASAVIFAYIYTDDDPDNFLSSQGTLDSSTGAFKVVVEDVPTGESSLVLSFAILDSADAPPDMGTNTVYDYNVGNVGCGNALTLILEWDPQTTQSVYDDSSSYYFRTYMDLTVIEPTGAELPMDESTIGLHSSQDSYPMVYTVYGDNSDALGTYNIEVYERGVPLGTEWTLTAKIRDEVVWVESGVHDSSSNDKTEFEIALDDVSRYEC